MNNQYTEDEKKIIDSFKISTQNAVAEIKLDGTKFESAMKNFGQTWINMQYALEDLSLDSLSFKKESRNIISNIQVEGIVYLIKLMEKEIPEYTNYENNNPTLKSDIRVNIGQEMMKLNLDFDQRDSLIDGLSTFIKPEVITQSDNTIESTSIKNFANTIKVIEELDGFKLNQKFNLMNNNEIAKTVSEAGQIFIQEVKENKIDLKACFEKFSTVWYAIPFTRETFDVSLETLRDFKYTLAQQLPEYGNNNEGKMELDNKIAAQLATQLVKSELCTPELRDVVIMAMTDFDKVVDKKFLKPDVSKNETTKVKLKNN